MTFNSNIFLSFFFIATILSIAACQKEEDPVLPPITGSSGIAYPDSKDDWEGMKTDEGDSYIYQTSFSSFDGFGNTTEIEVDNGVVVARTYEAWDSNGQTTDSYTESQSELNTHNLGAPTSTIDELYDSCLADYLSVDVTENTIYFNTTDLGLLTTCGYVPNGCQDDCFTGIKITAFEWR